MPRWWRFSLERSATSVFRPFRSLNGPRLSCRPAALVPLPLGTAFSRDWKRRPGRAWVARADRALRSRRDVDLEGADGEHDVGLHVHVSRRSQDRVAGLNLQQGQLVAGLIRELSGGTRLEKQGRLSAASDQHLAGLWID